MSANDMLTRIDCRTVVERPLPSGHYAHLTAVIVRGCSEGCCDDYECPDCGTEFRVEYPN